MDLPKRKPTRLAEYDYSTPGAYFVTVCVKGRKNLLSKINVGDGVPYIYFLNCPGNVILSASEESLLIGEVSTTFMRSFTSFRMTVKMANCFCNQNNRVQVEKNNTILYLNQIVARLSF